MNPFQSSATPRFWRLLADLPVEIQNLAAAKYELFRSNPYHPSLGFSQKGRVWTVNVGRSYRAIAHRSGMRLMWFWIGSHEDYNNLLNRS